MGDPIIHFGGIYENQDRGYSGIIVDGQKRGMKCQAKYK